MEDFLRPGRRISRKPVASNNESYPLSSIPSTFANVSLASSVEDQDATKAQPDWNVEAACCFLGVISLAAIAATLTPFQGRPLPQLPYDVSLNSLISLYVLLLKAAMFVILCSGIGQLKWNWFENTRPLQDLERFDEASRGPIGAFKLIWGLRGRNILVTLGSVITVLSIAIDPFAQQIVRYSACQQISSQSEASIPRTNLYSNSGIHIGANLDSVDLGMQSAVNVGVFSPDTVTTPFTCDTGNCTFPQYRSFAYCGTCNDISSEVVITTSNETLIFSDNSTYTLQDGLNFTLPSGLSATRYEAHQFAMGPSTGTLGDTIQAMLGDSNGPYQNGNVTETSFACDPPTLEWGCRGYGAAECSLEMCIKTYSAYIENGKLYETELYSDPADFSASDPKNNMSSTEYLSTIDMSCVDEADKQTLTQEGYTWNDTTKWLGYYTPYPAGMSAAQLTAAGANLSAAPVSTINSACVYQTESASIESLSSYFETLFAGYAGEVSEDVAQSSDLMAAMFNSGNVSDVTLADTFKNISISMTNYIRQNGDPVNSKYSVGQVLLSETCVHVRWQWLTFPAALFVLTLVFFVGMVIKTTSRYALSSGNHDFKSYALPLVFTELETHLSQRPQELRFGMNEMAHEARGMRVRLSKTENGWKFVKDN
ncbi:uncharacterized protein LY89DRAFT_698506 [Mollisia scopiformis]|uniref:Uncharacterized protein n=1 Tax=Mollisia scopiformis TaxID=149040 RepID=A0A194X482_MOLSC|nr:uncharacterized protein LY89DRAFT_698506 [Mollisia scopiformis]KUJ14986.1 hypothetical protein LY89DRAFT_698506 [Mollisia scopiformis]